MTIKNRYAQWLGTDFDLCVPVVDKTLIEAVLSEVSSKVFKVLGLGPRPLACLDLEQLQVADYRAFKGVSHEQQEFIATLHGQEPIVPEEMIFLALRSLFQFAWPKPESNDDIIYAASYDRVLTEVLVDKALSYAKHFTNAGALLPYWGRLAFLNVMAQIPAGNVDRFGLGQVACTLVKKRNFNATTFALENGPVIGMNYALQPILKHLNAYLLHYLSTQDMAGPNRLSRAWEGILPTVLHFWSDVIASRLTESPTLLYGEEVASTIHYLTVRQVEFIVMHELGHVALEHAPRLRAESTSGHDITSLRHEFEFAADAFAIGLLRSKLLDGVRDAIKSDHATGSENPQFGKATGLLQEYESGVGGAFLLFLYMDFVQRAGELLRHRLGAQIKIREQMDTHPVASVRLRRLEIINAGEYVYTSPVQRYAQDFLQAVLDHAATLDNDSLLTSVRRTLT